MPGWAGVLVVALSVVAMASVALDTWRLGAPPMASSPAERQAVITVLRATSAELGRPLSVVEAGAGFGGLAVAIADALPASRVTAVEAAVLPGLVCALRARMEVWRGHNPIQFRFGDAGRCIPAGTDVVVCFLGPDSTARLARAIEQGHPGVRVVSVGFRVPGWRRGRRVVLDDAWRTEVAAWSPPVGQEPQPDNT